jgi:hypothetical protein
MMVFTSDGISGGAGSDGMDGILPDTPIVKGSRNALVYVMMTVQHTQRKTRPSLLGGRLGRAQCGNH